VAFDAGNIVARMKLDNTQFKAGISSSKKEVVGLGLSLDNLVRSGALVYLTKQAVDLGKAFYETAARGAELKETAGVFDRVAAAAGISSRELIKLTQSSTGVLSKTEIQALANQLELVGVGMERLPQLAQIAESIADATGKSTKDVLETLISGTARTSDRMLRLIGINVQFKEGMTEDQKQAQFLNDVLSKGADIVQRLGDNTVSAADNFDRAKTSMHNFHDEMAKMISGPVGAYLGFIFKLKDAGVPTGPISMWNLLRGNRGGGKEDTPKGQTSGWLWDRKAKVDADAAQAALDAQKAAKAYFDALLRRGSSRTVGGPKSMGGYDGPATIDQTQIDSPEMRNHWDGLVTNVNTARDAVSALTDGFAGLFEEMITNSGAAGRAFFAGIMGGLAGIASNLGDFFIQMGIGTLAIKTLNPFAAIAAGIALKMLGGVMRGVAFNNAPHTDSFGQRHLRQPLIDDNKSGSLTVIVQGDFVGDKAWVQRLAQQLRMAQRNYGTPLVIQKAGATT